MGSVGSYYKCPVCGSEDAHEEFWYHTGEYARHCFACGWSQSHMRDYNSERILFKHNMPMDKNILDITLPDSSDHDFYDNAKNKILPECVHKAFADQMGGANGKSVYYSDASLLIDPLRNYIAEEIKKSPEIREYAEEYSKHIPSMLYSTITLFIGERLGMGKDKDDARRRIEQIIYELYVIETKVFDKHKNSDLNDIINSRKDDETPINPPDAGDDWTLFYAKDHHEYMMLKYIDIADIIADYRKNYGYFTFAFWYINDFFSTMDSFGFFRQDQDSVEKLNRAANNVDYASGRFDTYNSDDVSLYARRYIRHLLEKYRNAKSDEI